MTGSVLIYNGGEIRAVAERLNLTDMWKSAGSPPKQRPADWKNDGSNIAFLDHVALISNAAMDGIWRGTKGNGGSTWAHWQIGLAYAKYLSPEFHMWCNTVVRDRMEGKVAASGPVAIDMHAVGGMMKAILLKTFEERVPAMIDERLSRNPMVAAVCHVPALKVAVDRGIPQKGRRQIVRRIGNRLEAFCQRNALTVLRDLRNVRLFPQDAIDPWMKIEGAHLISDHMSSFEGQGILPFPRSRHRGGAS